MPIFSFIAALSFILCALGGVSLYQAHRAHRCLQAFFPRLPWGCAAAFFLLMALVMILGFARSMLPIPPALKNALGTASAYWMGLFVYLLVYLLLADALYCILGLFLPLAPLRTHFIFAAVALALGTCAFGVWHAGDIRHVAYDVPLSAGADVEETTLVLISDLHLGAVGSEARLERIVREINAQQPDVVCIAGDFFDNDFSAIRSPEKAVETLKKLQAAHGVFVCAGNHDSGKTVPQMLQFLKDCGIELLADEYAVIDNRLVLAGRLDASPIGGFDGRRRAPLESVLAGAPEGLPVVVMDHNPAGASSYGSGVSLVLSGHTHKGQVFPGGLITGMMYDVDHGHWQKDAAAPHVIVTSGVGTWGMPMRVGTDSEVVTIRLHR